MALVKHYRLVAFLVFIAVDVTHYALCLVTLGMCVQTVG